MHSRVKHFLRMTYADTIRRKFLIDFSERCFRDAGHDACRSCLVTATPCDLKNRVPTPRHHLEQTTYGREPPMIYNVASQSANASQQQQGRAIQGSASAENSNFTTINLFPRSYSLDSRQYRSPIIQESEEHDMYKLPKASYAAPHPMSLPLPSPPKVSSEKPGFLPARHQIMETKSLRQRESPRPIVYTGTAPVKGSNSPAMRVRTSSSSSGMTGNVSHPDSSQIATSKSNGGSVFKAPQSFNLALQNGRQKHAEQSSSSLASVNGCTEPQQDSSAQYSLNDRLNAVGARRLPSSIMQATHGLSNEPNYYRYEGSLEKDSGEPHTKRARSDSAEEGSFPEDKRGTSVKKARKTVGPWQARRPQTACEGCRSKK